MKADTQQPPVSKSARTTRALFKKHANSVATTAFVQDFMADILIGDRILDNYISLLIGFEASLARASQAHLGRMFLSDVEAIHLSDEELARLSNE
jgi:hypothetical protein